jgi:hypothetical protein
MIFDSKSGIKFTTWFILYKRSIIERLKRPAKYNIRYEFYLCTIGLILSFLLNMHLSAANIDRTGTASGSQLLIPVGARNIALGGSAIAVSEGVEAMYWNPAGLAQMKTGAGAVFSYMRHIADIGVNYAAAGVNAGNTGLFGISIKALRIGSIDVTTVDQPDGTGEIFSPTFFTLGISYSRILTDRAFFGVNVKIISERIPRASATGIAFDAGIQYHSIGGVKNLSMGVVIKNFGPAMKYDGPGLYRQISDPNSEKATANYKISTASFELPSLIEIGLTYHLSLNPICHIESSVLFQNSNFSDDEYKLGLEFSYKDQAFIRAGYNLASGQSENYEYIFGFVWGGGVHLITGGVDLWIDYAYRPVEFFNSSHVFTMRLGF